MIKTIGVLLSTVFSTVFLQNLVLCGGFGLSPMLRRAANPNYAARCCLAVAWFSTVVSVCGGFLFGLPALSNAGAGERIAATGGVLLACYLLTYSALRLLRRKRPDSRVPLGACAFNSLVMAVPLVNARLASPMAEGIGIGVGAGLAFGLSVWLLRFGIQNMENNPHIPRNFRGMPALLIYVGILSLAFTAIFGRAFMA